MTWICGELINLWHHLILLKLYKYRSITKPEIFKILKFVKFEKYIKNKNIALNISLIGVQLGIMSL